MRILNPEPLILITNDDGINSKGLEIITKIVQKITANYLVVAPDKNCSGYGHSITLAKPIRLNTVDEKLFSCDGTPTDCVMIALSEILKGKMPDLIISGINMGYNLGGDITYSGTVGAALEGAFSGIKSIAISKNKSSNNVKDEWTAIERFIPDIIKSFLKDNNIILNVNVPNIHKNNIKGIKFTKLAKRKPKGKFLIRNDAKDIPYYWLTTDRTIENIDLNSDVWAINNNFISITPLNIDLTDYTYLNKIKENNYSN